MKALVYAAALALLPLPALAQDNANKSVRPHDLAVQAKRSLTVNDRQKAMIRDGLVAVHTQQKAPKDFKPQVGAKLPMSLKVGALPQDLVRKDPAFRELGYAKTASDILVIDPMKKTIIAIVPRKFAADPNAKPPTPVDWANGKGRELTGQSPEQAAGAPEAHQPAGDSGDVPNGDVNQAKEKK
jgi:hypothetical protein